MLSFRLKRTTGGSRVRGGDGLRAPTTVADPFPAYVPLNTVAHNAIYKL